METNEAFKKSMTKDEVAYLVDIIKEKKNLHNKETDSVHNRMKEEAWEEVTNEYNAQYGNMPKTKHQLKLKWDNLKKAARKRMHLIHLSSKAGGAKSIRIPYDEILDKVVELLESTDSGLEVPYGGDGVLTKTQKHNKPHHLYGSSILKKSFKNVRRIPENDGRSDSKHQKNLAIAKYFEKKTEKLELEIKLLKMEVQNAENAVQDPLKQ